MIRHQCLFTANQLERRARHARPAVLASSRSISQLIQIPVIFAGLVLTLWTWKSLMLIVFQRKIIFMPYLGRHETLEEHPTPGVRWEKIPLVTSDGTRLVLCKSHIVQVAKRPQSTTPPFESEAGSQTPRRGRRMTLIYLQGNASSTPPRLPQISKILLQLRAVLPEDVDIEFWTVSYRGYWESSGSPSEVGLLQDVRAAIDRILLERLEGSGTGTGRSMANVPADRDDRDDVIVWGHSIGASLAIQTLPHLYSAVHHPAEACVQRGGGGNRGRRTRIRVILETPFDSVKSVLHALYPQPWLPYRYLAPFLTTRLDMAHALAHFPSSVTCGPEDLPDIREEGDFAGEMQGLQHERVEVLVVKAERDEIIPSAVTDSVVTHLIRHHAGHSSSLSAAAASSSSPASPSDLSSSTGGGSILGRVTQVVVRGALHQDCLFKSELHSFVKDFILRE